MICKSAAVGVKYSVNVSLSTYFSELRYRRSIPIRSINVKTISTITNEFPLILSLPYRYSNPHVIAIKMSERTRSFPNSDCRSVFKAVITERPKSAARCSASGVGLPVGDSCWVRLAVRLSRIELSLSLL